MLQRVMIDGISLPRLYIAENREDVAVAKKNGIPYICWTRGQEELIRILLRPVLEHMFPHINWNKVLGRRRKFKTEVIIDEPYNEADTPTTEVGRLDEQGETSIDWDQDDEVLVETERPTFYEGDTIVETASVTRDERFFYDEERETTVEKKISLESYVGDMSSYVNIEMLQRLRLMPAFIGDILECVKLNISSGLYWSEGYNKRLGLPVGRYNSSAQLPNLIILDVSGSIPRGISATMISLIDTMRTQLSADLIITSSISRFYPMGSKLPDPESIRYKFGYSNESHDFFRILTKDIQGKHYGHVFSFGDNDTPYYETFCSSPTYSLAGTTVGHVHHYHTGAYTFGKDTKTGYAKWCHMLGCTPKVDYDTSWCKVIYK